MSNKQHSDKKDSVNKMNLSNQNLEEDTLRSSYTKRESNGMDRSTRSNKRLERRKEDKVVGRIVTIIVLVLLVVGGVFGFSTYRYISSSLQPLDATNSEKVLVSIPNGSSNKMIGEILEEDQVIKSGMVFNYYTKFNNMTDFQAGKYQMSPDMTLDEIGALLQEGGLAADQADARILIPEGYDVDQVGDAIAENTDLSKDDFLALMVDQDYFERLVEKYPRLLSDVSKVKEVRYPLEGYLFPATYDYYEGMSLETIVEEMVLAMNNVMYGYYDEIDESDLNVHEVLTLASLVEKEGQSEEDRKNIAQVFFNRLAIDMPLQSDISILYALGVHKELVLFEDLEVDSPYNLYQNRGFGPGPFNNPSQQAIEAVLNPIENDYYYFVADIDTQEVFYAETLDEHNELVEKYVNNKD